MSHFSRTYGGIILANVCPSGHLFPVPLQGLIRSFYRSRTPPMSHFSRTYGGIILANVCPSGHLFPVSLQGLIKLFCKLFCFLLCPLCVCMFPSYVCVCVCFLPMCVYVSGCYILSLIRAILCRGHVWGNLYAAPMGHSAEIIPGGNR